MAEAAHLAEGLGGGVALVGGLAMQAYGSTRATRDVDVLAPDVDLPRDIGRTKKLTIGGVSYVRNGIPVDVIVRCDEEQALYEFARVTSRKIAGIPIPVVTPECLALMKYTARRDKDMLDLRFLLANDLVSVQKAVGIFLDIYHGEASAKMMMREFKDDCEVERYLAKRERATCE
jgi:hypothetical protein